MDTLRFYNSFETQTKANMGRKLFFSIEIGSKFGKKCVTRPKIELMSFSMIPVDKYCKTYLQTIPSTMIIHLRKF